jgi:flavin reductase (DIM6/NTAB) family NADH-FMN oxidoreductase RutF
MLTDRPPLSRPLADPALALIPNAAMLLTATFGEIRTGVIVRCVQQCAMHPPMLMVALEKGQVISPLIRDSRNFTLSVLPKEDALLRRMFARAPDHGGDPFMGIPHRTAPSRGVVPERAHAFFDCELVRHLDIDADFEVYVGMVHHAQVMHAPSSCLCAGPVEAPEKPAFRTRHLPATTTLEPVPSAPVRRSATPKAAPRRIRPVAKKSPARGGSRTSTGSTGRKR